MRTPLSIACVYATLSLWLTANTFTFNGSGTVDSEGVYTETQQLNSKSLTMTVKALSTFPSKGIKPSVQIKQIPNSSGVLFGVIGGAGGKANYTVDSTHNGSKPFQQESLIITFDKPVTLKSYSIGNLLEPEYGIFSHLSRKESTTELTGDFEKITRLPANKALRFRSSTTKENGVSALSFKAISVEIEANANAKKKGPNKKKVAINSTSKKTTTSTSRPLPKSVTLKSPTMHTWIASNGNEVKAMLLKVENGNKFTFMTEAGKVLTISSDRLSAQSSQEALQLAQQSLE